MGSTRGGGKQSATKPVPAMLQRNMQRPKVAQRSQKTMVHTLELEGLKEDTEEAPLVAQLVY